MKILLPVYVNSNQHQTIRNGLASVSSLTTVIMNTDQCGFGDYSSTDIAGYKNAGFTVIGYVDTSLEANNQHPPGCCASGTCSGAAGVNAAKLVSFIQGWAQAGANGVFFDDCNLDTATQITNVINYTSTAKNKINSNFITCTNNAGYDNQQLLSANTENIASSYEDLCSSISSPDNALQYTSSKHAAICYGSGTAFTQAQMLTYFRQAAIAGYHYLGMWPSNSYTTLPSQTFFQNMANALIQYNQQASGGTTSNLKH